MTADEVLRWLINSGAVRLERDWSADGTPIIGVMDYGCGCCSCGIPTPPDVLKAIVRRVQL